jgi:hypothetical protein
LRIGTGRSLANDDGDMFWKVGTKAQGGTHRCLSQSQ